MKLNLEAKTKEQGLIKAYLEENAGEPLAGKINGGTPFVKDGKTLINRKTLDGFFRYASDEARKLASKGAQSACVEDKVVYGWAIHYFEEESIEGTLYNEDGSEYRKPPAPPGKGPESKESPLKPPPKPQMSFFELLDENPRTPECDKPDFPAPREETNALPALQTVDPETGEILSGTAPDGPGGLPAPFTDDEEINDSESSENSADDADSGCSEVDDFDVSAFEPEALALLSELFGDEIELR